MALTNKDIEKLSDKFATKQDLEKLSDKFATKRELQEGLDNLKSELKNQIITSQDKILKRFEDTINEQKVSFAQYQRQENKLEGHEKRIKTLEDKVLVS